MDDQEIEGIDPQEPPDELSDDLSDELSEEQLDEPASNRSWLAAALVGLIMLAVGLVLGYVGRGEFGPEARAAEATAAARVAAEETQAAGNAEMMDVLVQNTRHFKGDENAGVTIIEFSDFQ